MHSKHPQIQKLLEHYKKISLLGKVQATLDWDLNVNLPPKASEGRAEQTAYLEELSTDMWLDKDFRTTLENITTQEQNLTQEEKALVRNLNHAMNTYTKVPKELLIKKAQVTSNAFIAWRKAKEKNHYPTFLPFLKQILEFDRQIAEYIGYKENPYDALLDEYEPGLTASFTKKTFDSLKTELVALLEKIKGSKYYEEKTILDTKQIFSLESQKALNLQIMKQMGYDFDAGRMDVSAHPFTTTLDRYDIRLTTKYAEDDFRESFTACMHETGHALYEQGINPDYASTPLEGGVSLGIHESLSRFWENMVGKNPAFLQYFAPYFEDAYEKQLAEVTDEELVRLFNHVSPSFIRIEADEITYSLHIILRFEIENKLINSHISPEDAPEAWRTLSKELFDIVPDIDSQGILQDVHWAYGSFGYFPSYALGNLYGAQFLDAMKKDIEFEKEIGNGNLLIVKDWLDKHVHTHGSLHYPKDLMTVATGKELDPKYFVEYLKEKYTKLYEL